MYRERERCIATYIYIYIYTHTYTYAERVPLARGVGHAVVVHAEDLLSACVDLATHGSWIL